MVTHTGIEKPGPRVQRTAEQKQPRGLFLGRGRWTGGSPKWLLYIPSFSFAYSSGLTTVTVHCAVNQPQSAVRVVVP